MKTTNFQNFRGKRLLFKTPISQIKIYLKSNFLPQMHASIAKANSSKHTGQMHFRSCLHIISIVHCSETEK